MKTATPSYDVFNYLPDGIIIVDERGVIIFANDTLSEMLGYSQEQLIGLNMLSLLADIDVFSVCIEKIRETGKSLDADTDFIHNDGNIVHTLKNVRMIRENGNPRFFVTIRNLAEVNLRNRELRHSYEIIEHQAHELSSLLHSKNQELEEILQSIDEVIWYIDNQTLSLHYVNDAVKTIFGYAKEAFLADSLLWQQQIHPDDRSLVRTFFETLMPGLSQEIRFRIHRANGELRWINSRIHHHPRLHLFIGITRDITES